MAFISLLAYIFTIYIRPQEWIPAVYAWPLVNMVAIATAALFAFEAMQTRQWRLKEPPNLLLLGFFACVLLSHISHAYLQATIDSFLDFGKNVIMFFLFVNILNTEKRLKISIWFIVILTVILAVQGIHQFKHGIGWAGQHIVEYMDSGVLTKRINWIGIFNDPNDLALTFVVAAGFLLAFIFGNTNFFVKIISLPLLGVLMRALYFTNSRGGYLAMAATGGFYFLRRMKNKVLGIVIGGILAFAIVVIGPSRMSTISVQEGSAEGRIEAWYQGFQMLKRAPLFGVGYGMFMDYHFRTAHNSYILVAAEEGIVGLFFWVALIYMCFKGLRLVIQKYEELKPYAYGLEAGLFGFLSASYFLSRSYVAPLYILFALSSAFAFTLLSEEEYSFLKPDGKLAGYATVAVLIVVWISMRVSLRLAG